MQNLFSEFGRVKKCPRKNIAILFKHGQIKDPDYGPNQDYGSGILSMMD